MWILFVWFGNLTNLRKCKEFRNLPPWWSIFEIFQQIHGCELVGKNPTRKYFPGLRFGRTSPIQIGARKRKRQPKINDYNARNVRESSHFASFNSTHALRSASFPSRRKVAPNSSCLYPMKRKCGQKERRRMCAFSHIANKDNALIVTGILFHILKSTVGWVSRWDWDLSRAAKN